MRIVLSGNKVKCPISEGNLNFLLCSGNFRRGPCWRHCKYKEWVSFFLGSWEMNRSAEQTNRVNREAVLVRFVCSALRFISHEPRKKDTHSLCDAYDVDNYRNSFCIDVLNIYLSNLVCSMFLHTSITVFRVRDFNDSMNAGDAWVSIKSVKTKPYPVLKSKFFVRNGLLIKHNISMILKVLKTRHVLTETIIGDRCFS